MGKKWRETQLKSEDMELTDSQESIEVYQKRSGVGSEGWRWTVVGPE